MIATWMLYTTLVSGLLALAAWAVDRSLRMYGMPGRGVWALCLALSVLMPLGARYLPAPRETPESAMNASGATAAFEIIPVAVPASWTEPAAATVLDGLDGVLPIGWMTASLLLAAWVGLSLLSLRRRQRLWTPAVVSGAQVLVSRDTGPTAVGFLRPAIVVPKWVLGWDERMKRMIVDHELQHIHARDPQMILAGLVAIVLMPWNPVLWWQFRRLRFAVEADCDTRVLRGRADVRDYGDLLLEVGRTTSARRFALAALSEPRSFLERRIRMMIAPRPCKPLRRAVWLLAIAVVVPAAAFAIPAPDRPSFVERDRTTDSPPARMAALAQPAPVDTPQVEKGDISQEPTFTPYEVQPEMLNREEYQRELITSYPAGLREAGIGGTTVIWLFIDEEGTVGNSKLRESSGYPELDEVALEAARVLRFKPAINRDEEVPVWIQFPVTFQVPRQEDPPARPDDQLEQPHNLRAQDPSLRPISRLIPETVRLVPGMGLAIPASSPSRTRNG